MKARIEASPEVEEALREGRPVVALESTLISHGLPRPDNLRVARELEEIVRDEGAVPATVGVVDGVPRVGLGADEIELLATAEEVAKLSARDLPIAATKGIHGATTVAATAHLAARLGIRLFATGGLGGVHRGARESWDVSADLAALSRTPVAVVCSGVKSILDVPATLEYLETLGVPVVGFGTDRFPGFYLSDSGYSLDWSLDDETQVARLMENLPAVGLERSGLVIANPVSPEDQLDPELHDEALKSGLEALERHGMRGREVTPFLLDHFLKVTGGRSLEVNEKIVRNNARLAARIAVVLASGV